MKHRNFDQEGKFLSVRMCVSCRQCKGKSELFRVVKSKDGVVQIDEKGSLPGRGAYVCKNNACIERAQKIRGLERGIGGEVSKQIYEVLLEFEN